MKPFNLKDALAGKPVVTRDGRTVTNVTLVRAPFADKQLVAYITGTGFLQTFHSDGVFDRKVVTLNDLFMAPTNREYINLYADTSDDSGRVYGYRYTSKEAADRAATLNRIACVEVDI